jgi:hypothetical protein
MVASPRQRLILPLAPTGAGVIGVLTALIVVVLPSHMLDSLVVDSGFASLINAAQPPLGFTARALLVLVGGGIATMVAWVALFVAVGTRSVILQNPRATSPSGPALRHADVHPDAPPRQPVFANRDLGTPFLDVRAEPVPSPAVPTERALPADLDMPLAAFDPQSFAAPLAAHAAEIRQPAPITRTEPAEAPLPIRLDTGHALDRIAASMQQAAPAPARDVAPPIRFDAGPALDRIAASMQHAPAAPANEDHADEPEETAVPVRLDTGHTLDLIAASMQQPPALPAEAGSPASVRALLDRLERSVARREAVSPAAQPTRQARQDSIRDTLDTLRGLATRTG